MEAFIDGLIRLSGAAMEYALHSLWIGLAAVLLITLLFSAARKTNAATRYWIWWMALFLAVILPFYSFLPTDASTPVAQDGVQSNTLSPNSEPYEEAHGSPTVAGAAASTHVEPPSLFPELVPLLLFLAWAGVTAILLCRILRLLVRVMGIKKRCIPFCKTSFEHLLSGKRRVPLMLSSEILYPAAAGLGSPMILVPSRMADHLPENDLEAVILHELAHLARRDDWARLAQKVMEALFFFHPAIYWISRNLNLERELACDNEVVARTGRPVEYCRCLTRLMEFTTEEEPIPVLAALMPKNQIFTRFKRILGRKPGRTAGLSLARFFILLGIVISLAALSAAASPFGRIGFRAVTCAQLAATFAAAQENESEKIYLPPELADRIESLPSGKIVDWSLKIYSLPISFILKSTDGKENVATLWHHDKHLLRAVLRGRVSLTEDDGAVARISPIGFLAVRDESGPDPLELEVRSGPSGKPEIAFFRKGESITPDDEIRAWMAQVLNRLIHRCGLAVEERSQRILNKEGVEGLLKEISRIEGTWIKGEYFTALIQSGKLNDSEHIRKALALTDLIEEETVQAQVLIRLVPCLKGREDLVSALRKKAMKIASGYDRKKVLNILPTVEYN